MATNNTRGNYGKRGARVPPEKQAEILELCRQGVARNEISRRTGISSSSVSGIVKRAGLTFDRSRIKVAAEARAVDNKSRRVQLSAGLLDDIERIRGQMFAPTEYVDHGGKDFDEARWTMDEPTHAEKLKLAQAAATLISRHLDLERHDSDQHGLAAVDEWLKGMLGD